MKKIFSLAAVVLLAAGTSAAQAQSDAKALATGVCSSCHGPEGHSISPVFPNLAGQQSAYIVLQLDAFRGHLRGDPNAQAYMWGMASQLSDATMQGLADYYAAQKPAAGKPGAPALMAEGRKIYEQGIPSKKVQACAVCHGANAEGAQAFPRLAGQHVEYLIAQLEGFKTGTRGNAPIMINEVRDMTAAELRAVATYA
ncbi:MAG TPA: c-type cytochrome, partial [Burkholderiales bacterium]|nr:c-type cytochrome [Burkholderiales bacterium]